MIAIKLEKVGKKFILIRETEDAAFGLFPSFSTKKEFSELWALRDISLSLEGGNVFGIIGRNGAGKTTLLNILAGISSPTTGKVEINGRVSSMLTLGAGFQEELTGKENIYLNASILGMSRKEIKNKYNSIAEFSELEDFLDVPLRSYSQGMKMRLGFSIATSVDFDIILIDEIISVGDGAFQRKSFERLADFKKQGKTMVITLHSLDYIERVCDQVFLLEEGRLIACGSAVEVVNLYRKLLNENRRLRVPSFEEDFA
jgi:ABC-type polysaccharide/polyol phosphate transport system ATPase subunit